MSNNQNEWTDYFKIFEWSRNDQHERLYASEWILYATPAAEALLKAKAQSYGSLPSVSSYIRAFEALKAEGAITKVRAVDPLKVEPAFRLTAADYQKLSAAETTRRYMTEPAFKSEIDRLIAEGQI